MRGRTSSSGIALRQPVGGHIWPWCTCPLCAPSTQALARACTQRWGLLVALSTESCSAAFPRVFSTSALARTPTVVEQVWLACPVAAARVNRCRPAHQLSVGWADWGTVGATGAKPWGQLLEIAGRPVTQLDFDKLCRLPCSAAMFWAF